MKYSFNIDGEDLTLVVDYIDGGVTYLKPDDVIFYSSDRVYDDLTEEISNSGLSADRCYEIITDDYYRTRGLKEVEIESLTYEHAVALAKYLEELRLEEPADEDGQFYNDGLPWTPKQVMYF
ncbi:hypothetical protein [Pseudomonas phage vB_PseuGesM_254]|uniref:Uncharacterized protein n=1 Tax=Pseudomonas phage vB_PseuGesM_254 TaxID=3092638 RepID=A0AAX4G6A9_9CAUD|nr:hypothetical protein [Pseudomonas phage PseuGes_254]